MIIVIFQNFFLRFLKEFVVKFEAKNGLFYSFYYLLISFPKMFIMMDFALMVQKLQHSMYFHNLNVCTALKLK